MKILETETPVPPPGRCIFYGCIPCLARTFLACVTSRIAANDKAIHMPKQEVSESLYFRHFPASSYRAVLHITETPQATYPEINISVPQPDANELPQPVDPSPGPAYNSPNILARSLTPQHPSRHPWFGRLRRYGLRLATQTRLERQTQSVTCRTRAGNKIKTGSRRNQTEETTVQTLLHCVQTIPGKITSLRLQRAQENSIRTSDFHPHSDIPQ
jgi:hypothetical protein